MNEKEMTDLLHRATDDLAPDVTSLVAGGLRRGQVRQRRRRAASVAAVAVAVVAVGGGARLLGAGGLGGRAVEPVEPAGPAAPTATARATPPPSTPTPPTRGEPPRAQLAVSTADVPATFASLAPGEVSAPDEKSGPDTAPVVDFTWNGFGVRVGLTPDDYVSGHRVLDPMRRCADQASGRPCRQRSDGTVILTESRINPPIDGGTRYRSVTVFRPDGWDVLVMVFNGSGKAGPVMAPQPPFDLAELEQIASSDVWFR